MSIASFLVWSLLMADPHADGEQLRGAAQWWRIPVDVFEGVAAVESGYKGGNNYRGAAGEIGRMQIKVGTARDAGCAEPVEQRLREHGYNIACGARILRGCYDRYGSWSKAIRCYNGSALPASTVVYLEKVHREIGHRRLTVLDGIWRAPP